MHSVVLGLGFGDEGKGHTVNFLVENHLKRYTNRLIVVRFSGGPQAGHGVYHNDLHHVFSHFGSGALQGTPTFWSKYCPMDPVILRLESDKLKSLTGKKPKIYISESCPIITPIEIIKNRVGDGMSCGMGVGITQAREENHHHLNALDLLYPWVFKQRWEILKSFNPLTVSDSNFLNLEQGFLDAVSNMIDYIEIVSDNFLKSLTGQTFIFEGSQGLMLDQHYGFYPYVTRTNTGLKNVKELLNHLTNPLNVYLVTRAYQTRHGLGPMSESIISVINPYEINKMNDHQFEFKTSLLDIDLINYAIDRDPHMHLQNLSFVVTNLDGLKNQLTFESKSQGLAFTYNDEIQFLNGLKSKLRSKKFHDFFYSDAPYSNSMRRF